MGNDQLSTGQYVFLYGSTLLSSFLSIAGSTLIIVSVTYRGRQQLMESTLFQFLLGLSICDIAFSIVLFSGPFSLPAETGFPLAIGNQGTCTANAFFNFLFSMGGAFYNCFMSIHFWRTVQTTRNNQQQSDWCFQVSCHSLAAIVSFLISIAGVVLDVYHPHPFSDMCYTARDAGRRLGQVRLLIVGVLTIIGIYCTTSVVLTVRRSLQRSGRYMKRAISQDFSSIPRDDAGSSSTNNKAGLGWSFSTRTMMLFNSIRGSLMSEIASQRLDISTDPPPTNTDPSTNPRTSTMSTNPASQAATNDGSSTVFAERSYPLFTSDESSEITVALSHNQQSQIVQENPGSRKPPTMHRTFSMDKTLSFRRTDSKQSNRSQKTTEINQRKEVAVQAIWYTAAYLNTILVPIIVTIVMNVTDAQDNEAEPQYFFLQWCVIFFVPIQGALNFLVFIRPRYNGWKAHFIREQQFEAKHSLPTINDTSSSKKRIPSTFVTLKKAVLEDVPKKRKRRPMAISGASNISGITGSGQSLTGSTRRFSRVSFASADGTGTEKYEGLLVQGVEGMTTNHVSEQQQPSARVVSKPVLGSSSSLVEDAPADGGSPNQNTTPCESIDGEQRDNDNEEEKDVSNTEHYYDEKQVFDDEQEDLEDEEDREVVWMEGAHESDLTKTETDFHTSLPNLAGNPTATPDPPNFNPEGVNTAEHSRRVTER